LIKKHLVTEANAEQRLACFDMALEGIAEAFLFEGIHGRAERTHPRKHDMASIADLLWTFGHTHIHAEYLERIHDIGEVVDAVIEDGHRAFSHQRRLWSREEYRRVWDLCGLRYRGRGRRL